MAVKMCQIGHLAEKRTSLAACADLGVSIMEPDPSNGEEEGSGQALTFELSQDGMLTRIVHCK